MSKKRYLFYISQNYSYAILRPLQKIILARGDEVRWFLMGDQVADKFLKPTEHRLLTIEDTIQWQPHAVFVPGNVVPSFIPGVKVGVFHGFDSGKVDSLGRSDHFNIRNCFDLYCTQGPDSTLPFEILANKHGTFNVVETGWPTLDPLFENDTDTSVLIKNDERPVILFCSTFSPRFTCAPIVFDKVKQMAQDGRWRWIVQFHPKMNQEIVNKYKLLESDNLSFIETDNVLPLLKEADVMLCDTSSVLIMFLLQGKPVVTFNNKTNWPHLLNVSDVDELEPAIENALSKPPELLEEIQRYCDRIHPNRDGRSSERVLAETDKLIDNGLAGLKRKPLNIIRNLKMRKILGYWKL
ncbi:CDP-glycerol glycerophosphotransferase family protein [Shewanella sp. MF05960]|uniref:CDP-glycerol glycerophosphotransferase family protein n=1 Tax=Shewanella sp. MF05960 TaxID=3434874 RepID=UPI003D7AAC6A